MPTTDLPLVVDHLTFRYQRRAEPSLVDISMKIEPGGVYLIAGSSGCGKTTLMRCINGLAPRVFQGDLRGDIRIFGKPVVDLDMAQLSQQVGTVLQDPERQIVSSHVFNEVAFGLENLALPRYRIINRVEQTLDYLGISHLRDRETFQLSGGEKQKVALAGVLAMQPQILLLDEPLASLDPASAVEALALFKKLSKDGISVLIVEHRVEDVLSIQPDRIFYMDGGSLVYEGNAEGLYQIVDVEKRVKLPAEIVAKRFVGQEYHEIKPALPCDKTRELVRFDHVSFQYRPDLPAVLEDINFSIHQGDIIAILGPNGAGKTTLVKHALGLLKPTQGKVLLEGHETVEISVAKAAETVGYVFQSPSQMLFAPSVDEELAFGPKNLKHTSDQIKTDVNQALQTVHLETERATPPLALSFGQQKRVSIAAVLSMKSRIIMMDEPTAGQDYWNYISFMDSILQMPGFDAILFITHDLDLALIYANNILLMSNGRVAAFGRPEEVLKEEKILRETRIVKTSLFRFNQKYLPQTGRFLRAEALSRFVQPDFSKDGGVR